ncbi:FAD-binding oxidoreductase [Streptomyces sp. NPDC058992]|uniref:FAD-binding oxidoreductase n=1 Tax=Streptomyces sp. NPDC058992 TaxID=3346688 RepID=UPI00368AEBE6
MTVLRTEETEREAPSARHRRTGLEIAAEVVGADRVTPLAAGLGPNASRYRSRAVAGVVRPRTAEEVRRLVELFADDDLPPLHAFSTGGNWGLGSREPARDGAVALDLAGLDRIRALDTAGGWAVLEPGVTQVRLAERLAGTGRMLNLTASSAHTSVVGNALDRGVGLRRQRVDDLAGLEVALPGGELIRVGWWPVPGRTTPVYAHGLGPSLLPLFVQSNLGVVTAAAVRLLPRPEALRVIRLDFRPEALGQVAAEIRSWVSQGLARGVVKIYNEAAARAYGSPPGLRLAHVCVDGTRRSVDALTRIVTEEAAGSGLFQDVSSTDATDPDGPRHEVARWVERAYAGEPDAADVLFETKAGASAARLDQDGGFLFFLPLVPFTGPDLARADELLAQVRAETGVRCGCTANALDADVVDCVITIRFDRDDDAAVERAHRALDRLHELFAAAGFAPYRLGIEHIDWADRLAPDPGARALARRLKELLDPHRAIAPGRYA